MLYMFKDIEYYDANQNIFNKQKTKNGRLDKQKKPQKTYKGYYFCLFFNSANVRLFV